jgi:hypothetical protein
MTIKLYGETAKAITAGQQFIAVEDDVEGRKVIILKPIEKVYS